MRCLRSRAAECGAIAVVRAWSSGGVGYKFSRSMFICIPLAVFSLALSACSASRTSHDYQSYAGAPAKRVVFVVPPKVQMEDDGLPGQAAPRLRARPEPDDSSEPFSPNYGPPPVGQEPVGQGSVERVPTVMPKLPLRKAALTAREARAVREMAIAVHKARRH